MGEPEARARHGTSPAALRSARPCNFVDREDREEEKCGQEGRGSSHGLLKLPLHVRLLQRRAHCHMQVLEEGA